MNRTELIRRLQVLPNHKVILSTPAGPFDLDVALHGAIAGEDVILLMSREVMPVVQTLVEGDAA